MTEIVAAHLERVARELEKLDKYIANFPDLQLGFARENLRELLAAALAACAREEAKWWHDYFLGKPQSGKLGIERLAEPSERLAALERAAGKAFQC